MKAIRKSKKQTIYFTSLSLILAMTLSPGLKAQNTIPLNEATTIFANQDYIDYLIPEVAASSVLTIEAKGADGGMFKCSFRTNRGGGSGALAKTSFKIGNGDEEIAPGSIIRLIVGRKGNNNADCIKDTGDGAGGGGGTGVLILPAGKTSWKNDSSPLVAAGGGGGAARFRNGRAANTEKEGRGGFKSDGTTTAENAFKWAGQSSAYAEGGASVENDVTSSLYNNDNLAKAGIPKGGAGGSNTIGGGFGFGGGGGSAGTGGGGGGGYAGGDAGYDQYQSGGGGGSFANPTFGLIYKAITTDDATKSPGNGYIKFQISESVSFFQLAAADDQCIGLKGDDLHDGDNMELENCNPFSPTQSWRLDGEEMKLAYASEKCMNVDGASTSNDTNIRIRNCNNTNAQKWIYDGLTKQLRSKLNLDKCMDSKLTNGSNVKLWSCSTTTHQKWDITDATTISEPTEIKYIVPARNSDLGLQSISGAKWNSKIELGSIRLNPEEASFNWVFDGQQIKYGPSKDLCLGLENKSTANGTIIQLMSSASTHNTRKWIYNGITQEIRSAAAPDKCIQLGSTSQFNSTVGDDLKLMNCSGNRLQRFDVISK